MTSQENLSCLSAQEPDGVLIVHKHKGVTSHDIVGAIRRLYHTKKVGHTGTLDPMAEGVLVVLIGRAAKAAEYLVCDKKSYKATLRLGITTDTEDITGTVLSTSDSLPTADVVREICRTTFTGKISQIPPMYSALKVNGKKLCDLARAGVTVERQPREIEIFSIDVKETSVPSDYVLCATVSSGTYIRTLCADIGAALGCGGTMASLCRTEAGGYSLEDAVTVKELEVLSDEKRIALLRPTESLFTSLPKQNLKPFYEHLIRNGCSVALSKLKLSLPIGTRIRLASENGTFFGLGEVVPVTDDAGNTEPSVKCVKLFQL